MMKFAISLRLALFGALGALVIGCGSDEGAPRAAAGSPGTSGAPSSAGSSSAGAGVAGGGTSGSAGSAAFAGGGAGVALAGSGGAAAGSGGAPSNGGSAGSGGTQPKPSLGCGAPAGQTLNAWVEQPKLTVNGKDRQWWVWLPTGYDPSQGYPVVFTFHGCGSSDNYVPMQKVAGDKAILVRGTGITGNCWTYGATGDDVKFFDAMLADLNAKRCVDQKRVFTTGYSSGSWLVNTLNCERGDKLRASGSVSGGVAVDTTKCVKAQFGRIFIHDSMDPTNDYVAAGNKAELARLVKANHCSDAAPVPEDPAPCARYQGCDAGFPVVLCQSTGKGHDRRDDLAPGAFWKFFSSF